jgi:hypothetical protein
VPGGFSVHGDDFDLRARVYSGIVTNHVFDFRDMPPLAALQKPQGCDPPPAFSAPTSG